MSEEEKNLKGTDDFGSYEDALEADLEALYSTDFAKGDLKEEEKEQEQEQAKITEAGSEEAQNPDEDQTPAVLSDNEEDRTPEEIEADEDIYNDINDALASQIKAEVKREKRLKRLRRSRWWLLSLIPVLGIFVLLIRPLRRNCPKWFMILRTLIFAAFAVEVLGVVASNGGLALMQVSGYAKRRMGKKLEITADLAEGAAEGTSPVSSDPADLSVPDGEEDKRTATLLVVTDTRNMGNVFAAVLVMEKETGVTRLVPCLKGLELELPGKKTGTLESLVPERLPEAETALSKLLGLPIDGYLLVDTAGLKILADTLGNIKLKDTVLKGEDVLQIFEDTSDEPFTASGDFSAFERHFRLFAAYWQALKECGGSKCIKAVNAALPKMLTDLPNGKLADNLRIFINGAASPVYYRVPNGFNYTETKAGYIVKDTERLTEELGEFIYGEKAVKKPSYEPAGILE